MQQMTAQEKMLSLTPPSGTRAESLKTSSFSRCSQPPSRGRPMRRTTAQEKMLSLTPPSGTRAESLKTSSLRQAEE